MDNLEYIDDYFKGKLTDEQKLQFEERVQNDPPFSEELAFYISATGLLKTEAEVEKRARFKELYLQSKTLQIGQGPVRKLWPYIAAAAMVILVACLWWVFGRVNGPERLADRYIDEELMNLPTNMGVSRDSLQDGIMLYNQGHLPEAGQVFQGILQKDPGVVKARIYTGIVHLRLKEYDQALDNFQQLEKDTTLHSNPALFYESLTLMKRLGPHDAEKARQLLQQIVDRGLDTKEDARKLLENW